jgi:hypothetical protein
MLSECCPGAASTSPAMLALPGAVLMGDYDSARLRQAQGASCSGNRDGMFWRSYDRGGSAGSSGAAGCLWIALGLYARYVDGERSGDKPEILPVSLFVKCLSCCEWMCAVD